VLVCFDSFSVTIAYAIMVIMWSCALGKAYAQFSGGCWNFVLWCMCEKIWKVYWNVFKNFRTINSWNLLACWI